MKIKYEILWFEDQPEALEHDLDAISRFLVESGFSLSLDMRKYITDGDVDHIADRIARYNKYDMIVFDYDLGKMADGSDIAKKLRARVYTDMVFYSGNSAADLRKVLYEKTVDGVFLVDRSNFADEFIMILEDHIKKACDINSIRGVVMDETSRFDRVLRAKCTQLLAKAEQGQLDSVRANLVRRIKESADGRIKNADKITCPIAALADFKVSDFNLVRHRLADLLKHVDEATSLLSDNGSLKDMQDLRNRLAHLESVYTEDGWMSLSDNPKDRFNFERFRQIRKTLREIGLKLDQI